MICGHFFNCIDKLYTGYFFAPLVTSLEFRFFQYYGINVIHVYSLCLSVIHICHYRVSRLWSDSVWFSYGFLQNTCLKENRRTKQQKYLICFVSYLVLIFHNLLHYFYTRSYPIILNYTNEVIHPKRYV